MFLTNTNRLKIRKSNKTKRGKAQSLSNETFTISSEQQQQKKNKEEKYGDCKESINQLPEALDCSELLLSALLHYNSPFSMF